MKKIGEKFKRNRYVFPAPFLFVFRRTGNGRPRGEKWPRFRFSNGIQHPYRTIPLLFCPVHHEIYAPSRSFLSLFQPLWNTRHSSRRWNDSTHHCACTFQKTLYRGRDSRCLEFCRILFSLEEKKKEIEKVVFQWLVGYFFRKDFDKVELKFVI